MSDTIRASLDLLYNVSRELTSATDLRTVLARVLTLSSEAVGAERATVVVVDEDRQPVDAAIIVEGRLVAHTLDQLRGTLEQGLAGWVLRSGQPALVADTSRDERWMQRPDDSTVPLGAKSAVCVPVIARERIVGVLTLVHPAPHAFTGEHLDLLTAIADQAGNAVDNARLMDSFLTARRRYQTLFEDSIDPIWISDWEGRVLEANRQAMRMSGHKPGEMAAHTLADLLVIDPGWLEQQSALLRSGEMVHFETVLRVHGAADIAVEAYVRRVQVGSGDSLQWIARDLTERKALDKLRDELMAMIYHDLRSPLSNIISSLDMFHLLLPEGDDNLHSILTIALRSSERMQRLISTLLDINRLETGQSIIHRQPVEAAPLMREAVEAIRPVLDTKTQEMEVRVEEGLPRLNVDVDMVRRVVINLLDNATKFTAYKGKIAIDVVREGEMAVVTVSDNGPGIPTEALETVFEKYSRLSPDRYPKGIGLGLAFCRLAVQAHGGRIWVESRLGEGSKFHFTLPLDL